MQPHPCDSPLIRLSFLLFLPKSITGLWVTLGPVDVKNTLGFCLYYHPSTINTECECREAKAWAVATGSGGSVDDDDAEEAGTDSGGGAEARAIGAAGPSSLLGQD